MKTSRLLAAGGTMSAAISILHMVLVFKPEIYRWIGPGQGSALAEMAVQGSSATTIFTAVLALYFALGALYAFSGAGFIGKLPLLRGVILAIGVIYLLRALFLPTEIKMVLNEGYPFRFVVFSALSLLTGLLYLGGYFSIRGAKTRPSVGGRV